MAGGSLMGGRSKRNARALLAADEITQAQYDEMMKSKEKGKKKKTRSLFDVVKEAISDNKGK